MIVLKDLTKVFTLNGRRKVVANQINATFPTGVSVGLLGRNGSGKSTLLKLIAGTTHPTSGQVISSGSVSFPVGLASSLHPDLTGAQNTRFVARIYGADTDALMIYVEEFAELGSHFHLPVRSYSSGMRGRLSFGINMGLEFDTYLVDEVTAVGDQSFKQKSRDVFLNRMKNAGAVFVSHSMGAIREMCTAGAYLDDGKLVYFSEVDDAIDRYMFSLDESMSQMMPALPEGAADMKFPRDARMLFGIGLPQTRADWLGDCLRRHRPCHFSKSREPHYFDSRTGLVSVIRDRRFKTAQQLAQRMQVETGDEQRNTLCLLSEVSALSTLHTSPSDGPDRHNAYIDYILQNRKTQPIVCDFTPGYALLPRAVFDEMSTVGWARFVGVLRDPAQRLWAQIWTQLPGKTRTAETCGAAARALIEAPEGQLNLQYPETDYTRIVGDLEDAVDPKRIYWLFHENLTGRDALRAFCDFLDIPNVPEVSLPPLPVADEPDMPSDIRIEFCKLLAPQYRTMQDRFGAKLPDGWNATGS
jgi:ABC-type polysaccharide/polyol phosphate transport system ATPase subunit